MRKIILITLLSLYFLKGTAQEVKVMTWNIWHGGLHGKKVDNFEKDTLNVQNVLKVIKQHGPDLIFMQETYCCGMEIARHAGYPYSWRGSSNLSIHSKYPIADTLKIFNPFNAHGAIIDVNGKRVMVFNIWLNYLPDTFNAYESSTPEDLVASEQKTRVKEIKTILKHVDSLESKFRIPIIIGGDFNAASHLDWVESTKKWHFGKVVEWPVSKVMTNQGYTDSFREVNPDPTTTLEGTWGFLSDGLISDRIDYIYYKGNDLKPISSKIIKEDPVDGFFNSDHRAVLTVFRLK